ncbi:MAG: response regulator [Candidatus Sumerlaeia bacterium]|nr:response regulator [Candidatus Sumerlaeia bacterium]
MAATPEILIVEDDAELIRILKAVLKKVELEPRTASTGRLALQELQDDPPAVVLLDMQLPDMSGMEILKAIRASGKPATVIVMTAHGSMEGAIEAMREGAYDFLTKPLDFERVRVMVRNALERHRLIQQLDAARDISSLITFGKLRGSCVPMRRLYERIREHQGSLLPVMIQGSTGCEFEECAQTVHESSPYSSKPIQFFECKAGNGGELLQLLSSAEPFTLVLKEVQELNAADQKQLLEYLQTTDSKSVRLITLAQSKLKKKVDSGGFSSQLYDVLATIPLQLPKLRQRGEDILELAQALLLDHPNRGIRTPQQFSTEVETALYAYDWPQNMEELNACVEMIVKFGTGKSVTLEMLPATVQQSVKGLKSLKKEDRSEFQSRGVVKPLWIVERDAIQDALKLTDGNMIQAAMMLEISPAMIYRKQRIWDTQK